MNELPASNDIDFGHSYLRFSTRGVNHTPRLRIDAACTLISEAAGKQSVRSYYLSCACIAENMYRRTGLIQEPVAEFTIIVNPAGEFQMLKRHAAASHDVRVSRKVGEMMPTHDGHGVVMVSVDAHVRRADRVTPLTGYAAFREALLGDRTINCRTAFVDADTQTRVVLDYPANTTNVAHDEEKWQVDAGPILFPLPLQGGAALEVERMELAYIVFNRFDYAEVVLNQADSTHGNAGNRHYTSPRGLTCTNEMYVLN